MRGCDRLPSAEPKRCTTNVLMEPQCYATKVLYNCYRKTPTEDRTFRMHPEANALIVIRMMRKKDSPNQMITDSSKTISPCKKIKAMCSPLNGSSNNLRHTELQQTEHVYNKLVKTAPFQTTSSPESALALRRVTLSASPPTRTVLLMLVRQIFQFPHARTQPRYPIRREKQF